MRCKNPAVCTNIEENGLGRKVDGLSISNLVCLIDTTLDWSQSYYYSALIAELSFRCVNPCLVFHNYNNIINFHKCYNFF